jgi:NAD(P)H-hydrate epimerase
MSRSTAAAATHDGLPRLPPLSRAAVRDVDRRAIEEFGIPGIVLMENAGRNAALLLHAAAGDGTTVSIACGRGNNGGDGFVIARHLDLLGHPVRILLACPPEACTGDAAINLTIVRHSGLDLAVLDRADAAAWEAALDGASGAPLWIVDALLGTGASGPPRGAIAAAIDAINSLRDRGRSRTFAVDIPSGMDCDTGAAPGAVIRADVTATFVARKIGFDAPEADRLTGAVHVLDIGAPRTLLESLVAPHRPPGISTTSAM